MDIHSACPVCNSVNSIPVFQKNGYLLARCVNCTMIYVDPMPADALLQAHYQNPAYFSGDESLGYLSYADMHKALTPHFKRRLHLINHYFPRRGRLLDYGCADGYFLTIAQKEKWQISGVELARGMAHQAEQVLGIPIPNSLDELSKNTFEVVTLWEVIEHLSQPVNQLQRLRNCLRPGGLLMLSTPNTGHWQAVREPEAWVGYRPPSHLLFFTSSTLEQLLKQAGFERIAIKKTSPLPPLPGWLRRLSAPLQHTLTTGQAKAWPVVLWTWRIIRIFGWGWQRLAHPEDDIFTTLEATAFRPA